MDTSPFAQWFAEAARLTSSAQALAAANDVYDLAYVRGLNDALEARVSALVPPQPIDVDYFMLDAANFNPGQTPAASTPMVRATSQRPLLPRPAAVTRAATCKVTSPPIRFDAPLTVNSPIATSDRTTDLTWHIGAYHVEALQLAMNRLGEYTNKASQDLLLALWAISHGLSVGAAARKFSIPKTRLNTYVKNLITQDPDAVARRILEAQTP